MKEIRNALMRTYLQEVHNKGFCRACCKPREQQKRSLCDACLKKARDYYHRKKAERVA